MPAPRPDRKRLVVLIGVGLVALALALLVSRNRPGPDDSYGATDRPGARGTTNPGPVEPTSFPLARTDDDPASADAGAVDLTGAPDFHFTFGDGSGLYGYDVLKVRADGTCRYTARGLVSTTNPSGDVESGYQWRRADFVLAPQTVTELRALLREIDFFRLKKAYHADVHDGTQRWAKVEASGKRKGVYWNNHFPEDFERLHQFVRQKVLAAHQPEILASRPIDLKPADIEPESYD
jgi:hypothetical protein